MIEITREARLGMDCWVRLHSPSLLSRVTQRLWQRTSSSTATSGRYSRTGVTSATGPRRQAQGQPAAGSGVGGQEHPRRPPCDRSRRPRRQRTLPADHGRGRFGADATVKSGKAQHRRDRTNRPLDRRGGKMAVALGVHRAQAPAELLTSGATTGPAIRSTLSFSPAWKARGWRLHPKPNGAS